MPSAALGTALAQATGIPLLFGSAGGDAEVSFDGESYRGVKAILTLRGTAPPSVARSTS